jgi:TM2 domain-containing membrane protein YozV
MEQRQFEQAVDHIARVERVQRLLPGDLSRRLGLPIKEVERMLDRMVTNGSLELDSDDDGNLYYFVPGVGTGGVFNPSAGPTAPPVATGVPAGPSTQAGYPPPGYGAPPPGYGAPPPGYGAPPGAGWPSGAQAPPAGQVWPGGYAQAPYPTQGGYVPPAYGPPRGPAPGPNAWGQQTRGPWQGQQPGAYVPPPSPYGAPTGQPGTYGGYAPPGTVGGWGQPQGTAPYGPAYGYAPPGQVPYGHNALVPAGDPYAVGHQRSPSAAAMLSLFFPGAGQLYNGQVTKGLGFFIATLLMAGTLTPVFLIPYIWSILDAHATSRHINAHGMLPP